MDADNAVSEAILRDDTLLLRQHIPEHREARHIRPLTQHGIGTNAHSRIEQRWVDGDKLAVDHDFFRRVRIVDDFGKQPAIQLLHAGFGKDTRNKFDALLCPGHDRIDARHRGRLQRLRIDAFRCLRNAGAGLAHRVDAIRHFECLLPDEWDDDGENRGARVTPSTDYSAKVVVKRILHIGHHFVDAGAGEDGLRKRIQRTTHEVSFDPLKVHDDIRQTFADNGMRRRVWPKHRVIYIGYDIIINHLEIVAESVDAVKLVDTITIAVVADQIFTVLN